MRTEDGCIIQRCLNGEPEAFGLLVDKYKAGIYSFAYIRLGDFRDAQDVTQEVFVQAYRDLKSLRRWESFVFWLYRIASTHCGKWIRTRSRRPDVQFIEDQDPQTLERPAIDSYREDQVNESLREALYSLQETYREVLALYYFGGMNSVDIAKALGMSPSAIRKRLSRARAQLKEEMVAMMSTAFEGQRLQAGFTFRIMETVRRIRIHPAPRTAGLPWGLSLVAGIIFTILTLNPNINLVDPADIPMAPMSFRETEMAKIGEIHVDILKLSQIPAISGRQGNDNRGDPGLLQEQNALLLAPRGEAGDFPEEPTARLGKGTIGQVAYSPDGKLVAAAGSLGIWLYDADNLNEIGLLEGHTTEVMCLAFSPDGEILASGDSGRTTRLWDVQAQKEIWLIQQGATSVAFSPDGRTLARGGSDITLWDVQTQEQVGMYASGASSVAFSPDGNILASGSRDKGVYLWGVAGQEQINVLRGHTEQVMSIAFSPDGKTVASGSGWGDGTVRLWDVDGQKQIGVLNGHIGRAPSVAFSPDGKSLASAGLDDSILLWDVQTQKEAGSVQEFSQPVWSVAFSPNGSILASGGNDQTVHLWDVREREQVGLLQGHTDTVFSVAFSPDGKTIASGGEFGDNTIRLWDVAGQEETGVLPGHSGGVHSVAFSLDSKNLASVGRDQTVRLWNAQTQEQTAALPGHTSEVMSIAFSPGGKTLASGGGWGDQTVRLWDVAEQRQVKVLKGHSGIVWSVAFSPDGKILASCSSGEEVDGVWLSEIHLWDVATQRQVGIITPTADNVRALAFSPDGKFLASGGIDDFAVRIWDVDEEIASGNSREVAILYGHTGWVEDIAFSPGGRWLASGSQDGTVLIWEVNLPGGPRPVEPEGKLPGRWGEIKKTKLLQNFPNPFNPETWIPFRLAEASDVTIQIYQQSGQSVRTLNLGNKEEGIYLEKSRAGYWDGRSDTGESVASGVYFYTLETGGFSQTRKMTVLR